MFVTNLLQVELASKAKQEAHEASLNAHEASLKAVEAKQEARLASLKANEASLAASEAQQQITYLAKQLQHARVLQIFSLSIGFAALLLSVWHCKDEKDL